MDYAIIETGGKQYKVQSGDVIDVEKLAVEKGSKVNFEKILLYVKNGEMAFGKPYLENKAIVGEVVNQVKGKKIIGFKYKPKCRYRKRYGHRQQYTRVKINEI